MTNDNATLLGQISLAVYALLLFAGGGIGYLKAGSKPSLIAGTVSGLFALLGLIISFWQPAYAFWEGMTLAGAMVLVFAGRLKKTGKFMPSGLLLVVSVIMFVLLLAASYNLRK